MVLKSVINKTSTFRQEYRKQVAGAIITAFGLVIALAWKDLITAFVSKITPLGIIAKYPYIALLYSAVILTAVAIIGIMLVNRWAKPKE